MVKPVVSIEGLEEFRNSLDPRSIELALTSTLNKTVAKLKTSASRDIREIYNVKAAAVKKTITTTRATTRNRESVLISTGSRISLKEFGARQNKRGVSVKVKKAGGKKTIRSAFIVDRIGGHVFQRKGKSRLPIVKLFGPAIPQMMSSPEVINKLINQAQQDAPRIFEGELRFRLLKKTGQL